MAAKELGYEFSPKWFLTGKNCPSLETDPYELLGFARAVLAHYARPTTALAQPEPDPAEVAGAAYMEAFQLGRAAGISDSRLTIKPVPVSERPILKSSDFNDANGHCWCGTRASVDAIGDLPVEMPPSWELREPCAQDDCVLPHHALPVPAAERLPVPEGYSEGPLSEFSDGGMPLG
jgi:hypothetical protein